MRSQTVFGSVGVMCHEMGARHAHGHQSSIL